MRENLTKAICPCTNVWDIPTMHCVNFLRNVVNPLGLRILYSYSQQITATKPIFLFYEKTVNRFANPLMIFKHDSKLKGVDMRLASHMDILPTVADLIDYPKPFKSWGGSLVSDQPRSPSVCN